MPTALAVMLLGVAIICGASEIDQVVQRPLVRIGEAGCCCNAAPGKAEDVKVHDRGSDDRMRSERHDAGRSGRLGGANLPG